MRLDPKMAQGVPRIYACIAARTQRTRTRTRRQDFDAEPAPARGTRTRDSPRKPKIVQLGLKMAPSWPQGGPKRAQGGPRWPEIAPRTPKIIQLGPKMAPRWLQHVRAFIGTYTGTCVRAFILGTYVRPSRRTYARHSKPARLASPRRPPNNSIGGWRTVSAADCRLGLIDLARNSALDKACS